jgi:hypothetical protein
MYHLMTKKFSKWVKKKKLNPLDLTRSLNEVIGGTFEANLGGHIYKKRVARAGKGKSGGFRTIICFKQNDRAVYVHGFSKSSKGNISDKELQSLKELAAILLNMNNNELRAAISSGVLVEVNNG